MKGKAILKVTDTNENVSEKNLPNLNPAFLPNYDEDIAASDATVIKTACIALNSLTTNTLNQIKVSTEIDITDFEGGEQNG